MDEITRLRIVIDQLQRQAVEHEILITALRKRNNELKGEIATLKLPWMKPIIATKLSCISYDQPGYRCRGGDNYKGLPKLKWCMQCKCYDPE